MESQSSVQIHNYLLTSSGPKGKSQSLWPLDWNPCMVHKPEIEEPATGHMCLKSSCIDHLRVPDLKPVPQAELQYKPRGLLHRKMEGMAFASVCYLHSSLGMAVSQESSLFNCHRPRGPRNASSLTRVRKLRCVPWVAAGKTEVQDIKTRAPATCKTTLRRRWLSGAWPRESEKTAVTFQDLWRRL